MVGNADLEVMKNGEHWFHTEEQSDVMRRWLKKVLVIKKMGERKDN